MVEKGVPMPKKSKVKIHGNAIYPWRLCTEFGDSFRVDAPFYKVEQAAKRFCNRNKEFKFSVHDFGDYCRVWRIK